MAINIDELFTPEQWSKLCEQDPSLRIFEAASQWQKGFSVANTYFATSPLAEATSSGSEGKSATSQWRTLQQKCWELYRSFGPVNASINSKADYTAGKNFGVYSDNLDINLYLKDFFYSYRNRLYYTCPGWVIRMLAESELFLLLAFDEVGKATVRVLEPSRIGNGSVNDGLLVDPDDATQTLFYDYYGSDNELIPDVRIALNPELLAKAKKLDGFDTKKTEKSRAPGAKFKKIGGYRRFVIHWKNLTGIPEYKRDISVLSTVLEAVNLYWNAIKWQLDHKKAQCAYTNVLRFEDSPTGKIAWQLWNKMTDEEKENTGLTKQLTPGSTLVLMPGLAYDVKAPQLTKLSGENEDLLNIAGAGARTPQDLWQGQSAGATHASLKSSRSPLEMEIENLQNKLGNFFRYEVLRVCFHVYSMLTGFPPLFDKEEVESISGGTPKFRKIQVEPVELIRVTSPNVTFDEGIEKKVNAFLGSQHNGLSNIGVSSERIAEELGVDDLSRQRREKLLEEKEYGEVVTSMTAAEKVQEANVDPQG